MRERDHIEGIQVADSMPKMPGAGTFRLVDDRFKAWKKRQGDNYEDPPFMPFGGGKKKRDDDQPDVRVRTKRKKASKKTKTP